jgi:hypothetical protein
MAKLQYFDTGHPNEQKTQPSFCAEVLAIKMLFPKIFRLPFFWCEYLAQCIFDEAHCFITFVKSIKRFLVAVCPAQVQPPDLASEFRVLP